MEAPTGETAAAGGRLLVLSREGCRSRPHALFPPIASKWGEQHRYWEQLRLFGGVIQRNLHYWQKFLQAFCGNWGGRVGFECEDDEAEDDENEWHRTDQDESDYSGLGFSEAIEIHRAIEGPSIFRGFRHSQ